jgi:hypothetical protein
MRVRRLVLAIAAGVVLLLGGLSSAGATGCVSNRPDSQPGPRWIGTKDTVMVQVPSVTTGSGAPQVNYGICVLDRPI